MIASLPPPALSEPPSAAAQRAAHAASSNQHALVNLIRLVKSLEVRYEGDAFDFKDGNGKGLSQEWETVAYARALLEALRDGNEQSSSTAASLSSLDRSLSDIESSFRVSLASPTPTPTLNPALIALPMSPSTTESLPISRIPTPLPPQPPAPSSSLNAAVPSVDVPAAQTVRKRRVQTDEYLARRGREDNTGAEAGLLPLNLPETNKPSNGKAARDDLPGDVAPGSGVGAAQLHEELGGQLADMSHRLKLNAIHFSRSLENEKHLIEESQEALEKNLSATRSSKKHLSTVSKKGRGTTCLTLGVVVLVMILFIWTYLLIRFT
ncbi:hypothetical protein IAT38_002080 [Cryptococcus sp. DSM 104549]